MKNFLITTTIVTALAMILGLFGYTHWFLDLFNHFRPLEIICLCLTLNAYCWLKSRTLGIRVSTITLSLFLISFFIPQIFYQQNSDNQKSALTESGLQVISFNVLSKNKNSPQTINWIHQTLDKSRTNIVLLMEVTPRWIKELQPLKKRLPYFYEIPRDDNFGIALYSDKPFLLANTHYFDQNLIPSIIASIKIGKKEMQFIGVHPLPPMSANSFEDRNTYLKNVRTFIDKSKSPTILAGDFNLSPWSPHFTKIIHGFSDQSQKLNESMDNLWRPHTWTGIGLLSMPIDHILYSEDFDLELSFLGPDLGSDHLPVVAKFKLVPGDVMETGKQVYITSPGTKSNNLPINFVRSFIMQYSFHGIKILLHAIISKSVTNMSGIFCGPARRHRSHCIGTWMSLKQKSSNKYIGCLFISL